MVYSNHKAYILNENQNEMYYFYYFYLLPYIV